MRVSSWERKGRKEGVELVDVSIFLLLILSLLLMLLGVLDSLVIVTTNIGSGYVPVSYSFDFASFWQAVFERGQQESPSSSLSSPSIFPPSSPQHLRYNTLAFPSSTAVPASA